MNLQKLYKGSKVLVTGASGYIGTLLVERLLEYEVDLTLLVSKDGDTLYENNPDVMSKVRLIKGDVRDKESWSEWVLNKTHIFHLAAQTSHYKADQDPFADWEVNVSPILYMSKALEKVEGKLPRVVFASTATVYGLANPKDFPISEFYRRETLTIYDVHKSSCEHYLEHYTKRKVLSGVSLRLANVYGASPSSSGSDRGILSFLGKKALKGEELSIYGSGEWVRDYVHVRDVVEAFLRLGAAEESTLKQRAFNVCTGHAYRFIDAVKLIVSEAFKHTGKKSEITFKDVILSPIDERFFVGTSKALQETTGWMPIIDMESGIIDLLRSLNI